VKDPDEVRDIVSALRFNAQEYRKINAVARARGLQFATAARMLALGQAEEELALLRQKDARLNAA
jgi:2-keto-3-deoxy-L-rhamnonate aldolase RhmA